MSDRNVNKTPAGIAAIVVALLLVGLAAYGAFSLLDAAGGIACD